jgi:hypothetical protein
LPAPDLPEGILSWEISISDNVRPVRSGESRDRKRKTGGHQAGSIQACMGAINQLLQIPFTAFGAFHDERANSSFHNHVFFTVCQLQRKANSFVREHYDLHFDRA